MQNTSLTRYQLVCAFINVTAFALVVARYLNKSQWIVLGSPYLSHGDYTSQRYFAALSPLMLLLAWPLRDILMRAVAGVRADEPMTSPRDLRSLLLPALGAVLFLWALINIGDEVLWGYNRLYEVTRSAEYGWLHEGGMFAQILGSNQYSLLQLIFIAGTGFILDSLILLVGVPLILKNYLRARRQNGAEHSMNSLPVAPLTRFQVTRAYICITVISFAVYWFFSYGLGQVGYLDRPTIVGGRSLALWLLFISLPTAVLVVVLPLSSLLAHAMNGDASNEALESPDQLRALFVPSVAFAAFLWSFFGLHSDSGIAYRIYEMFSFSAFSQLPAGWAFLAWPLIKIFLIPAFIIYPSVRDMIRPMRRRM